MPFAILFLLHGTWYYMFLMAFLVECIKINNTYQVFIVNNQLLCVSIGVFF